MEVNVVLIDDNRINLRHLVDYLEDGEKCYIRR